MKHELVNKNLVFIGEFKPTSFDKYFFIKYEMFLEEDFSENCIFFPDLTIIDTENFLIEIDQNKFSINFKTEDKSINIDSLTKILQFSKINALGFNFKRVLFVNTINDTKKFFFFENNVLNTFFNPQESAYGYYVSSNFKDSRLRLDIKPVSLQKTDEDKTITAIDFTFNFHFETSDYKNFLKNHNEYEKHTIDIIESYE